MTPAALHFSINHSGLPDIDPEKHRLVIHGLVRQPKIFSLEDLSRYPMVTRMGFVECGGNSAPMFSNEPFQAHGCRPCTGSCPTRSGPAFCSRLCLKRSARPESELVPRRRCRLARASPQRPGQEGLGRCHDRALPERRAADARQRLSDAPPAARLPGQHEHQVRAPHQAARSAVDELLRGQDLLPDHPWRHATGSSTSCRRSSRSSPIRRPGIRSKARASTRSPASPIRALDASPR